MEIKYKDSDNNVHQIKEGFEHLMPNYPLGYTLITDEEADLITASKIVPPTYAELRASEYPAIGDQLDALYHAGVFPEDMAAQIQAVKERYPKT
jgi:hypothetical protein